MPENELNNLKKMLSESEGASSEPSAPAETSSAEAQLSAVPKERLRTCLEELSQRSSTTISAQEMGQILNDLVRESVWPPKEAYWTESMDRLEEEIARHKTASQRDS